MGKPSGANLESFFGGSMEPVDSRFKILREAEGAGIGCGWDAIGPHVFCPAEVAYGSFEGIPLCRAHYYTWEEIRRREAALENVHGTSSGWEWRS